jgi:hypothetical protein
MKAVKAHKPNCKITSYVLNGGFYNAQENVFTTIFKKYKKSLKNTKKENYKINYLEEFKLIEKDLYYPYEIVYDFEARMNKLEYNDDKQLKITTEEIEFFADKYKIPTEDILYKNKYLPLERLYLC